MEFKACSRFRVSVWVQNLGFRVLGFKVLESFFSGSVGVDRRWLWVCFNKIPIYPIFYVLKGDYNPNIYPIII